MDQVTDAPEDLEASQLLAAADQADHAKFEAEESSAQQPDTRAAGQEPADKPLATTDEGTKPSNSETETAEQEAQRERDDKGRFLPKAKTDAQPAQVTPKEDTAYAKAQKERDRQSQVLANFEEEKRRERAALSQERQELARQRQEMQGRMAPQRAVKDGFTAPEYRQASKDFTANGDHENAYKAIQAAEEIERYEWQQYHESQAKASQQSFQANMEKEIAADPELNDGATVLSQAVQGILKEFPYIAQIPEGFTRAVEIAKLRLEAGSASELRKQLQEKDAELARLNKATQPARGGPTGPSAPRKFENLSLSEMHDELERAAEELDMQPA